MTPGPTHPVYFRRSLTGATVDYGVVVYAMFRDAPVPSPELAAGVGAFPRGYRPTENPGEVLGDRTSTLQYWTCDLRRDKLHHYERISEAEAFALYPRLRELVAKARASLEQTGDLPGGVSEAGGTSG
jgi:hypothetical protein